MSEKAYCNFKLQQTVSQRIDYLPQSLNYFDIFVIISMFLISGIERNPDPLSYSSISSTNTITTAEEQAIKDNFSVVHYNVQSILNKLDIIETELRNFDVISIIETWLDHGFLI